MSLADGFAQLLHSEELGDYRPDEAGGDVFLFTFPAEPDDVTVVVPAPGYPPHLRVGADVKGLQILVRARHGEDAETRAKELLAALHARNGFDLPDGTHVIDVRAVQSSPTPLGEDANGRLRLSLNFDVETEAPLGHRARKE